MLALVAARVCSSVLECALSRACALECALVRARVRSCALVCARVRSCALVRALVHGRSLTHVRYVYMHVLVRTSCVARHATRAHSCALAQHARARAR